MTFLNISGIVVRKGNGQFPKFFKWNEITNLVNHKRYFGVECQSYENSVQFLLDEADSAKYVWKMCVLQHTFYKMHASVTESNELNITLEHQPSATTGATTGSGGNNSFQQNNSQNNTHLVNTMNNDLTMSPNNPSSMGMDVGQHNHYNTNNLPIGHPEYQLNPLNYNNIHHLSSQNILQPNQNIQHSEIENFHAKQTQRVDLVAAATRQYPQSQQHQPQPSQQQQQQQHVVNNEGYILRPAVSSLSIGGGLQSGISQVQDDLVISRYQKRPQTIGGPGSGFPGQGAPLSAARSVNDLDQLSSNMSFPSSSNPVAHHHPFHQQQQQPQGTQLPLLSQPTLPTMGTSGLSYYRPAPDYETAIRNKYGNSILTQLTSNTNSSRNSIPQNQQQSSHPALITDAISTLHNAAAGQQQQNLPSHKNMIHRGNDEGYNISNIYQQQAASMYSTSTPELNKLNQLQIHQNQQPTQDQIVAELQRLNLYKPPPPYPGGGNSSSGLNPHGLPSWVSTPDLASQSVNNQQHNSSGVLLGGSSPDLVSRRNLGLSNVQVEHKNSIHRTMENLVHGGRAGYSTEELNNTVYHMNEDSSSGNPQGGLLPNSQPHQLKPPHPGPPHGVIPASTYIDYQNLMGVANSQNSGNINGVNIKKRNLDSNGEPIYQNQAELMQQIKANSVTLNKDPSKEPIYQNLPAHEKLLLLEEQQQKLDQQQNQLLVGDNNRLPAGAIRPESQSQGMSKDIIQVEQVPDIQNLLPHDTRNGHDNETSRMHTIGDDLNVDVDKNDKIKSASVSSTSSKIRGHVSRVAITNSRENLSQYPSSNDVGDKENGNYHTEFSEFVTQGYDKHKHRSHGRLSKTGEHKKSVTKINIIPSEQDEFEETIKAYKSELIKDVVDTKDEQQSPTKDKEVKMPKSKVNPIKKPERRRSTPAHSVSNSPEKETLSKSKEDLTTSNGMSDDKSSFEMQTTDKKKSGEGLTNNALKQQTNVMNHNEHYLSNENSSRKQSVHEAVSPNTPSTSRNNNNKHKKEQSFSGLNSSSSSQARNDQQSHNFAHAKNSVDLIGKNLMHYQHPSNSSGNSGGSDSHHNNTPRTPAPKPRGVRRKWGFHFGGSKSGSLKSIKSTKSDDGSHGNNDAEEGGKKSQGENTNKFGPMMLATLHGLTRSRPDLLTESLATFSAFTTPARMPKDEIGAHLEAKLAEGEVLREFERIPKRKLEQDTSQSRNMFRTACLAENVSRNRFKDVLPYEENRVRLSLPTDKDNKTGYINASHVSATVGDQQRFYIAGQGPLPNTVIHFWQMVLQCDVHLIVMLTEASVGDKGGISSNCLPYWPQKNGSTLEVGDFRINKQFTSPSSNGAYTTSTLTLSHAPSGRTRTIWHLQYTDWGDTGCPTNVRSYLDFLEEMSSLRTHIATSSEVTSNRSSYRNRNPPVLIHCSAGVGRTGITVLCDILLYCVNYNIDIDIPKMLTHLRQQRMLMVQTIAQYKFVHTVLIKYLKQSRLI